MQWLNEPAQWQELDGVLSITAQRDSDFWRTTHYGFIHDNGHLYGTEAVGDFSATVRFRGSYCGQYDQAGLMIRLDETHWIKAGIEFFDGAMNLSTVVTNEFSDWSVQPWRGQGRSVWIRLTRKGDTVAVHASQDGETFHMIQLGYFPPDVAVQVGPMCCAPFSDLFTATFEQFAVGPAVEFKG